MHACAVQEHWFALRRVGRRLVGLQLAGAGPRPLSEFYLSAYLATLRDQGYSIFLVLGALPGPFPTLSLRRRRPAPGSRRSRCACLGCFVSLEGNVVSWAD